MNTEEIVQFMIETGAPIEADALLQIENYFNLMIGDERVMRIEDEGDLIAIVTYSICNDYFDYYAKDIWDYEPHNPLEDTVYVEKLISKRWNIALRKLISQKLIEKYPSLTRGIWHRARTNEDSIIKINRRFTYV